MRCYGFDNILRTHAQGGPYNGIDLPNGITMAKVWCTVTPKGGLFISSCLPAIVPCDILSVARARQSLKNPTASRLSTASTTWRPKQITLER
jgi:hypothetical protein